MIEQIKEKVISAIKKTDSKPVGLRLGFIVLMARTLNQEEFDALAELESQMGPESMQKILADWLAEATNQPVSSISW